MARTSSACRRGIGLWRLFFFYTLLLLAPSCGLFATAAAAQNSLTAQIIRRQVRVTRDSEGAYRVIESLLVLLEESVGDAPLLSDPLPLVRLQGAADAVRGLGGDVAPGQVTYDPPLLRVAGPIARRDFQVAFTYRLPAASTSLELAAEVGIEELIVEVDKGGVEARMDGSLVPDGEGGAPSRPYRRYLADGVPPHTVVSLKLVSHRTDGRQRLAVLIFTALAAAAAGVYVWRSPGRVAPGSKA